MHAHRLEADARDGHALYALLWPRIRTGMFLPYAVRGQRPLEPFGPFP
jgi:hypothetical protein